MTVIPRQLHEKCTDETKDVYTVYKIFCFNLNVSTRVLHLVSSSLHLLSVELTLCTLQALDLLTALLVLNVDSNLNRLRPLTPVSTPIYVLRD